MSVNNNSLVVFRPQPQPLLSSKKSCLERVLSCVFRMLKKLLCIAGFTLVLAVASLYVIALFPLLLIATLIKCTQCLWRGEAPQLKFNGFSLVQEGSVSREQKKHRDLPCKIHSTYVSVLKNLGSSSYEGVKRLALKILRQQEETRKKLLATLEKRTYLSSWDKTIEQNVSNLKQYNIMLDVVVRDLLAKQNKTSLLTLYPSILETLIEEYTSNKVL